MTDIQSTFDSVLDQLRQEQKVQELTPAESSAIINRIQTEMQSFNLKKQKKEQESFAEGKKVVLTA